jgi:hypothetical protein
MKAKKHYSAPTMEVVEANLECTILAGSGESISSVSNCQVECLQWEGLDESGNAKSHTDDDNMWEE